MATGVMRASSHLGQTQARILTGCSQDRTRITHSMAPRPH
jgi:hypothetical protein